MVKKSLAIDYSASPFLAFEWHHGHPIAGLGGGYWFWSITWRSPWQVKGCQVHTDAASGAHKKQKKHAFLLKFLFTSLFFRCPLLWNRTLSMGSVAIIFVVVTSCFHYICLMNYIHPYGTDTCISCRFVACPMLSQSADDVWSWPSVWTGQVWII